jgi:glycosyltransferase involved in cell wall biosynthesis
MRIAIIGIRGLPPRYGGSETMAEEVGKRLVRAGHEVVVYSRYHNLLKGEKPLKEFKGIRLIHLPSINTKNLDTLTHSILAFWHCGLRNTADAVFIMNPGHACLLPILMLFRKRFIVQVDGMDWTRKKWNLLVRMLFRMSMNLVNLWSKEVLTDNPAMLDWYKDTYHKEINILPHGANVAESEGTAELEKHGLKPKDYYLFVGRLIPEKGVHYLIDAYKKVTTEKPLVIVGGSEYTTDYVKRLKTNGNHRIRFLGYIYGEGFRQLISNCYVYVQPSEVEGTSPVLLTAMGYGQCVLVNGIPENLYTIGDAGFSFSKNDVDDLARRLQELDTDPDAVTACGERVRNRVLEHFNWYRIAAETLKLFERL